MTLSIDADCVLAFWMTQGAERFLHSHAMTDSAQVPIGLSEYPAWGLAPDGTIHLVATSERERVRRKGFTGSLVKTKLPARSFVTIGDGLHVPSPEYCYLRLASMLTVTELAKAGSLLCANFSFDSVGKRVERTTPITTVKKIRSYVGAAENLNGAKNARAALRFLAGGAASPPEIDAHLLFSLPIMRGGRGCSAPELNGRVKLNKKAASTLGYADCYCDLLWRSKKCAVEYTSEEHHSGYRKQVEDEIRRAALEAMGYRIFFLTKSQLYSQPAFEGISRTVLHALGKRPLKRTREFLRAEYDLRKSILYEPSWIISRACRKDCGYEDSASSIEYTNFSIVANGLAENAGNFR